MINCDENTLCEFDFLKLYLSIMVLNGQNPIFDNNELEEKMYRFYKNEKYSKLFKKIYLKENSKSVNLNGSIKACYSNNLLLMFYKNFEFKSIVNFSYEDALNMINKYNKEQILLMQELCSNIIGLNEKEKIKQIVKK